MPKTKETPAGEWQTRVLAEFNASPSVVWRAQISTAPDGKEFAGIRKFIRKADGQEIADRSGISLLYDGGSIAENVDGLIKLLTALKGGTVKAKAGGGEFVLQRLGGDVLRGVKKRVPGEKLTYRVTRELLEMKKFSSASDAQAFAERTGLAKIKSGWKPVLLAQAAKSLGIKLKKS